MRVKRVCFNISNSNYSHNRFLDIQIIDTNDKAFYLKEKIWESDVIDNLSIIFERALIIFKQKILDDERSKIEKISIPGFIKVDPDDVTDDGIDDGKSIEISF